MKTSLASLVLGFLVAVWLTPIVRRVALRHRLVDTPDGRRVNSRRTPRVGGLAIAAAVLAPILGLAFYENLISEAIYRDGRAISALFMGAIAALGIGLADDLFRPPAKYRLLALCIVGVVTWLGGNRLDCIECPFWGQITLGYWSLPATVIWIVGIIVAFNFIDGLDGLAAGIALVSTITMFICASLERNMLWMTWTGAMAGSLLGFLVFNFNPASIFMGDAGSNFIGYLMAVVAIQTTRKQSTAISIAVPLLVLGIPLLDAALTMVRRALLREGLFTSERGHLHHRLLQLGLSHKHAVLVLCGVTLVLCLSGLALQASLPPAQLLAGVAVSFTVFGLMFWTGYIRPRDLMEMYSRGQRNDARQSRLERLCRALGRRSRLHGRHGSHVQHALRALVARGGISGVQYRCPHGQEVCAGELGPTARGVRLAINSSKSGEVAMRVVWTGRTSDPTARERLALRGLLAGLEASCEIRCDLAPFASVEKKAA